MTVIGNIEIFPIFSQYQISVQDVQPPRINRASTVSRITQQLSGIIKETPELSEIQVQGNISGLASPPGATFWALKDIASNGGNNQQIRCVLFDDGLIPDATLLDDGTETSTSPGEYSNMGCWQPI